MNCKEATYLHQKQKEAKLSFVEKLALNIHMLYCGVCKLFYKQMNELDKCVHHVSNNPKGTLNNEAKLKMQRALDNEKP